MGCAQLESDHPSSVVIDRLPILDLGRHGYDEESQNGGMGRMGGTNSPQHLLWTIGTSLLDASPEDAEERLAAGLAEICNALGAASAGVYEHDIATRQSRSVVASGADEKPLQPTRPSMARAALDPSTGFALLDVRDLFGLEFCENAGWPEGQAFVSWLDDSAEQVTTFVVVAFEPAWGADELEMLRGASLLIRQFMRRVEVERALLQRRALDEVALRVADALESMAIDTVDSVVEGMLRQVMDATEARVCFLINVADKRRFDIPVLIIEDSSIRLPTMTVDDLNDLTGANTSDLVDLFSNPRICDGNELSAALFGDRRKTLGEVADREGTVLVAPVEAAGSGPVAIGIERDASRPWSSAEIDGISTIASMLVQAQARCVAEAESQARFALQCALAKAGKRFLNVEPADAPRAGDLAIRNVAESLGARFALAGVGLEEGGDEFDFIRLWVGPEPHRVDRVLVSDLGISSEDMCREPTIQVVEFAPHLAEACGLPTGSWKVAIGRGPVWGGVIAFGFPVNSPLSPAIGLEAVTSLGDLAGQLALRVSADRKVARRLRTEQTLSDIADDFLGGSAKTAAQVESRVLERLAALLHLRGSVVGSVPPEPVIERVWRHPDLTTPGPILGSPVPGAAIAYSDLDSNAPVEFMAEGDSVVASTLRERWDSANMLIAPVMIEGEVVAGISAIREGVFDDLDHSSLRSVAGMLSQFRARVEAERRDEARFRSEELLANFVAELAEAKVDTLQETVNAAFMNICEALSLSYITIWRIDADGELYRPLYWADLGEKKVDGVPGIRPFGSDLTLDEARVVDDLVTRSKPGTTDPTGNVLAFRRDAEPCKSIFAAGTRLSAHWTPKITSLLQEISGVLGDAEGRIASQRYIDAAFENGPVGIVMRDKNLRLITCNKAFADFLAYDCPAQLAGTLPDHVYAEDEERLGWNDLGCFFESEATYQRADGGLVWGHTRVSKVEDDSGDHFWLAHVEDITERRRAEALLRFQATHDELTGLANRGRLLQELDVLSASPEGVAVLLLDLDRFKNVNDSMGHDRGDELLVTIADRLRLAVRPGDLVARLGGDEFAVTLAGPITPTEAEFVANRLLHLMGEPVTLGTQRVYPAASVGIAFSTSGEVADILRRADTAMYRAKEKGGAQTALFDERLQLEVTDRMATEAGLRGALRNSEFLVYYQPEVAIDDGRLLGAEALIRWNHPEGGVVPAASFIEVAEETGLVVEMGEFVLANAATEAAQWPGGDDGPVVRVNLAAAQLQREDTVAFVRSVLHTSGLAPHRLCLEITESAVMTDVERSERILGRLKELGVTLAVDDFGTGFSSLAYLKRFPVDALKIDRTFVEGLGEDDENHAFVRSIVSLADALGLEVVAEGVETQLQSKILAQLGCHRAQGYLYAKPGPAEDLLSYFSSRQDA